MDSKLFSKDCITLDGRMDEPVWEEVKTYTDFKYNKVQGGAVADVQTFFKIIPCEDRIYVGIHCVEPDMAYVTKVNPNLAIWTCDAVELFFSPSCSDFDFYQFAITFEGQTARYFYSEGGNIQPDRYAPEWNYAIYKGDDYWSVEVELPLTAFYMTPNAVWKRTWLTNVSRTRCFHANNSFHRKTSSWCGVEIGGKHSRRFLPIEGFPARPSRDDVCMTGASVKITEENEKGYCGILTVKTTNPEDAEFEFSSDYTDAVTVRLKEGNNEFTVPCCFGECKRYSVPMQLKRLDDGKIFKRYYPVRIAYEVIKLEFSKPEFRTNFYPGQDYSQVVGKVTCSKPVNLRLEGPGIETQEITAAPDGSFCFDTAHMEEGEAQLTVTGAGKVITKKIRRLAPNGHMMTWISGGNLIVNGKPVFAKSMSAEYWRGGESFKRRYDTDELYINRDITSQLRRMQPDFALRDMGFSIAEATRDEKPREELLRYMDQHIEENKDRDFAYYYLSDEPECRAISPIYLKYLYDYITEKDPYHVVRISSRNADSFVDAGDFFETHPYINPYTDDNGERVYYRPFTAVGKYVEDMAKMNRSDKCIGFLGTCFAGIPSMKDPYPTFDEYICNSWAGIIRGAKSLRQYAYHDMNDRAALYEGTRYIFSSLDRLEEILLFAKRTTLQKSMETECCLYEYGNEKMFVLVNFTQEPQMVALNELSGTWQNFRHNSTVTGPAFQLKPIEVLIATSEVKDADMPTYQETARLINKLEEERKSSKSLLFERQKDIKAMSSDGLGWVRKLFDGVKDNFAWQQIKGEDKFYEIDISKVKPTFNKVVISGKNIDNMEIRVRVDGELSTPAIADVQTEEFSTTFMLKESVTPDALRLEFHKNKVELYEIEVFQV
jgi:hypothetical protein